MRFADHACFEGLGGALLAISKQAPACHRSSREGLNRFVDLPDPVSLKQLRAVAFPGTKLRPNFEEIISYTPMVLHFIDLTNVDIH